MRSLISIRHALQAIIPLLHDSHWLLYYHCWIHWNIIHAHRMYSCMRIDKEKEDRHKKYMVMGFMILMYHDQRKRISGSRPR